MPLLFGIPFLTEVLFYGSVAAGGAYVISSAADSAQKGADASAKFMKEVIIPGAIIYAGFIYFTTRKKG